MFDALAGTTVVVAGGTSGIGLALARQAAEQGASVVAFGRDPERVARARDELGAAADVRSLDATDEAAMGDAFAELRPIDHVASFTGRQSFAPVTDTDRELFQGSLDARVWAARNLCAGAAAAMPGSGSITLCSGTSGWRPRPNRGAGAAATAATEAFGRAMAVELAPIRVNTLCPGVVDTPVLARAVAGGHQGMLDEMAARIPLRRIGTPDELAHAVLFLMTNTYVTGITLHVDGGLLLA